MIASCTKAQSGYMCARRHDHVGACELYKLKVLCDDRRCKGTVCGANCPNIKPLLEHTITSLFSDHAM